jgi:hypothetical protein
MFRKVKSIASSTVKDDMMAKKRRDLRSSLLLLTDKKRSLLIIMNYYLIIKDIVDKLAHKRLNKCKFYKRSLSLSTPQPQHSQPTHQATKNNTQPKLQQQQNSRFTAPAFDKA